METPACAPAAAAETLTTELIAQMEARDDDWPMTLSMVRHDHELTMRKGSEDRVGTSSAISSSPPRCGRQQHAAAMPRSFEATARGARILCGLCHGESQAKPPAAPSRGAESASIPRLPPAYAARSLLEPQRRAAPHQVALARRFRWVELSPGTVAPPPWTARRRVMPRGLTCSSNLPCRRYENDVGEVGADAIGVAGGQGPRSSELSVCTDEEIRQRDRGRDRSRLLSPPFAVAAIGGGTSDRGARGKVDNPYAPRLYLAGCQLRLLVADTNLGDADGIGSGSVSDDTLGDGGRRPCVER